MSSFQFVRGTNAVRALSFLVLFGDVIAGSDRSAAEGALAVGLPANVTKNGFVYGYTTQKASPGEARRKALELCREPGPSKSAAAIPLCTLVANFHDQCVAVAEDPQAGTPGVGWAIADDLRKAESDALAKCEATAGPGRRAACKIDHSQCDGTAQ
jgi:Domain of unknown function (DUF4189)